MMLAAWVLFLVLAGVINCDCPPQCTCDGDVLSCSGVPEHASSSHVKSVSITHLNETLQLGNLASLKAVESLNLGGLSIKFLGNVSGFVLESLKILNLSHNQLGRVLEDDFLWCPMVQHLDLSFNSIKSVDVLAFEVLEQILTVNLSNNMLHQFQASQYLHSSLMELDLTNNQLDEVPLFTRYHTKLTRLLLGENQYDTWPVARTGHFPLLEELHLGDYMSDGVEIVGDIARLIHLRRLDFTSKYKAHSTVVAEISNLATLQVLRLGSTKIENLNFMVGLTALERLEMNSVSLSSNNCPPGIFPSVHSLILNSSPSLCSALFTSETPFEKLTTLLIPSNNVTTIPFPIFPQISSLDVSDNPLNCSDEFLKMTLDRNFSFHHLESTFCVYPLELSGWNIEDAIGTFSPGTPSSSTSPSSIPTSSPPLLSELNIFLDGLGIGREHLFYACVTLATIIICLVVITLIVRKCKCKCCLRSRVIRTGWKAEFGSKDDYACAEDVFFPRADNEYTFDNFTVSDTITRNANTREQSVH